MRPRASKDLAQLPDPAFFAAVAEGIDLIHTHVARLLTATETLTAANQIHPAQVLMNLAEEEAAKILILLDAVRCPREPAERLTRQLHRFNDHLAKALYAKACAMRPTTLSELQGYVDLDRDERYLDGPNDIDWIFRNELIEQRESALYVDYVATDEGHHWADPGSRPQFGIRIPEPGGITTARALHAVGLAEPKALAVVAATWRPTPPALETRFDEIRNRNAATLQALQDASLLRSQTQDIYGWIVREWQYPMFDLDLSMKPVTAQSLRDRRDAWSPEY